MDQAKYIVTGAGGFVGSALACELLRRGFEVWGISRASYPKLSQLGIRMVSLDLAEGGTKLNEIFAGAEAVFHVAAKVDMWGRYRDFFRTNVIGTRSVIAACRQAGVPKLVFTSSPSVIADGSNLEYVDESYPYPNSFMALYPKTKAQAEREVLAANDPPHLRTIALRPHLIFGPDDRHLVPTIVSRAKKGRLVQIGSGANLTDVTYIEDCVMAHLCALAALDKNIHCHGRAYFISQGEATNMWDWIREVLVLSGVSPVMRKISRRMAWSLASAFEIVSKALPVRLEPLLTRFLVSQMTTHHYFNISAAKRDLGFEPRYTLRQAMQKTFATENSYVEA